MAWTKFVDMHSGGGQKLDWAYVYIEAPESEAEVIFYKRFGRNPHKVTCTCCGPDYSLTESEDLAQATGFERGCEVDGKSGQYVERPATEYAFNKFCTLEDYIMKRENVHFIPASHIEPHERFGNLPQQGFVWVGD